MVILARNWRCAAGAVRGELDVVARDGDTLVSCEVKTRRHGRAGTPLEAVTPAKVLQLRRLTAAYLAEQAWRPRAVRIDVIGIAWPHPGRPPELVHVRGVG